MTANENVKQIGSAKLRWRIYYRTNQTISSKDSTWEAAPSKDIVAVVWTRGSEPVRVELGTPYYIHMGTWINRVWDATLYLRKLGTVKFGRWTDPDIFKTAWDEAVKHITPNGQIGDEAAHQQGGITACMVAAKPGEPPLTWRLYYDDLTVVEGHTMEEWLKEAPTDGVLVGLYSYVFAGVRFSIAMRRHTFYYWKNGEMVNTDEFDELIAHHPQFKIGCPKFEGKSYLHYAEALRDALADNLEDVT